MFMDERRLEVALRFLQAIRKKDVDRFVRSETPEAMPVRAKRKKPKKPWPIVPLGEASSRRIICAWGTPFLISSTVHNERRPDSPVMDEEEPTLKYFILLC